jgi:hypothetical protein
LTSALKKAAGNILSRAELYRKLTGPQKICLWLVLGVVGLSFLFVFSSGEPNAGVSTAGVPAASGSPGQGGAEGSAEEWPFRSSFLDTPGQAEERRREANRRRIEQAILLNSKIEIATVICSPDRSPKYALGRSASGTAAVVVRLKAGVPPLDAKEAEVIRNTVSRGLNLEPSDVSLTDSEYKLYVTGGSQTLPTEVREAAECLRTEIKDAVSAHFSSIFEPSKFHVVVMVYLSSDQSTVDTENVDPAKTFSKTTDSEWEREETRGDEEAGGMIRPGEPQRTVTREKTKEEPFVSREKRHTTIPPGAITGAGVVVSLDLGAVKGVLSRDPRFAETLGRSDETGSNPDSLPAGVLDSCLSEYLAAQEKALLSLLPPLDGVSVTVMAQPFCEPQPGGAAPGTVLQPAPVAAAETAGPLGNPWKKALLVGAAVLSTLALVAGAWWLARRRAAPVPGTGAGGMPGSPPPGRAPEWVSRDGIREALASFHQRMGHVSSTDGPQETLLRAVNETAGKVRRRPDVAASVLRIWLAQDAGALRERTVRS